MNVNEKINDLLNAILPEDLFLVELTITEGKVLVILDGDQGVGIDQIGDISRELGGEIEALDLMTDKYLLEVTSPGLDTPLTTERQYKKNVGRDLIVYLSSGKELKGKLEEVTSDGIQFLEIVQKGNRKAKTYAKEATNLDFQEIDKAKVLVSFN